MAVSIIEWGSFLVEVYGWLRGGRKRERTAYNPCTRIPTVVEILACALQSVGEDWMRKDGLWVFVRRGLGFGDGMGRPLLPGGSVHLLVLRMNIRGSFEVPLSGGLVLTLLPSFCVMWNEIITI